MHRKNNAKGLLARHIAVMAALAVMTASLLAMLLVTTASQANAAAASAWQARSAAMLASTAAGLPANGTPAQDEAACRAVYHYHHEFVTDYGGVHVAATERAWYHAYHLAGFADSMPGDSMRYHIRHYLMTGSGWSLVAYDCYPDA